MMAGEIFYVIEGWQDGSEMPTSLSSGFGVIGARSVVEDLINAGVSRVAVYEVQMPAPVWMTTHEDASRFFAPTKEQLS